MKLNKIALAIAVGSVFAAPMAAQADVTISGVAQVQIAGDDGDDSEMLIKAGDVRVNFAADTDLGFGTGYGNIRMDGDSLGDSSFVPDAVKVGVKGDFGDVSLGDVGSAVGKGLLGGDLYDSAPGCNECLAYSNTFSGLGFKAGFHPAGNFQSTNADGSVKKGKDAGITVGVDYSINGIALGAGTKTRGDDSWTAIGAGYNLNGIDLGISYEMMDGAADADEMTNIGAKAYYGVNDWNFGIKLYKLAGKDDDIESKIRLEATKSLSDSMSVNFRVDSLTDDATDGAGDKVSYRVLVSKTF